MQRIDSNTKEIEVTLKVLLDELDIRMLEIFQRHPSRSFRVHQIRTILEYQGLNIGYGAVRNKLQVLSLLSLIQRQQSGNSRYRYTLSQ